jgi:hypothetical protein
MDENPGFCSSDFMDSKQTETGQTFEEFKKEGWNRPDGSRKRIIIDA